MKNYKRILSVGLVAAMTVGSSVVALASDAKGELSGAGNLEQLEAMDIFQVKLPTITDGQTTFDYILDPNGLIKESGENGKYGTETFEEGATLYFKNTTNKTDSKDYSKTSDKMTVINKSTQDVDISVKATVAAVPGVKMDSDGQFGEGGGNLYLALTDGTNTKAITENGSELTSTITKTAGVYKVKYDTTKKLYVKELDDTKTDDDFQKYEFQLTGACKKDAVWDTLKDTPPAVDVVWSVKDFTITEPQMTVSASGLISISNLTAEKDYESVSITHDGGTITVDSDITWDKDNYTEGTGGSMGIQLGSTWINWLAGQNLTFTLNLSDGKTITTTATLSAN